MADCDLILQLGHTWLQVVHKAIPFRWHSIVSFCHLASKKLSTLSLYRWFMGAFTSDMPEIGSSSLSRDRGAGIDRHRDAANRLQSCRNHSAIRFGSFVGNGNSNNRIVLDCWHTEGSHLVLMHCNFWIYHFFFFVEELVRFPWSIFSASTANCHR